MDMEWVVIGGLWGLFYLNAYVAIPPFMQINQCKRVEKLLIGGLLLFSPRKLLQSFPQKQLILFED